MEARYSKSFAELQRKMKSRFYNAGIRDNLTSMADRRASATDGRDLPGLLGFDLKGRRAAAFVCSDSATLLLVSHHHGIAPRI